MNNSAKTGRDFQNVTIPLTHTIPLYDLWRSCADLDILFNQFPPHTLAKIMSCETTYIYVCLVLCLLSAYIPFKSSKSIFIILSTCLPLHACAHMYVFFLKIMICYLFACALVLVYYPTSPIQIHMYTHYISVHTTIIKY